MTNAAIERKLAVMAADIRQLKKSLKINSNVEKARARLRSEILKGLHSGSAKPIDAAFWKNLRAHARRRSRT